MEMLLHARVLEMTAACIRLFDVGQYAPLPMLLRVAYEALVDQAALERDPYSEASGLNIVCTAAYPGVAIHVCCIMNISTERPNVRNTR